MDGTILCPVVPSSNPSESTPSSLVLSVVRLHHILVNKSEEQNRDVLIFKNYITVLQVSKLLHRYYEDDTVVQLI